MGDEQEILAGNEAFYAAFNEEWIAAEKKSPLN